MSFNQSRSDKADTHYRKTGRSASSNQQRGSSGGYGKGGCGGGAAPSPSINSSSSFSSNRSFKKSNNVQGGQYRVNPTAGNLPEPNTAASHRTVQNGSHVQPPLHGSSDALVSSGTAKQTESSSQRGTRAVPKAPTSQPVPMSSDAAGPTTPAKSTEDASKAFSLQFGSISPSYMNGMAIPARTSSAPPNLDEQKRDQARHGSFRSVTSVPTPPVPKQQPPSKDAAISDQSNAVEVHSVAKAKKDPQVSPSPPASQAQKSSALPMSGMPMTLPFHHSQGSVQFGGPNPQIQSQAMPTSLQMAMPMPLPMGNAQQVQQQVFVPSIQPHHIHSQGIMHQNPSIGFTAQMGPQLPPQVGIGISPQYAQQQGGKYAGPRKTPVKITHPDTHEELRLEKRTETFSDGGTSAPRSHPNMPSQSQPIHPFAASHPFNYYPPNSYNTGSLFLPSSSLPLTSSQLPPNSQAPRFNYPVNHGSQNMAFMNSPSLGSVPVNNKTWTPMHGVVETPNVDHPRDFHNMTSLTSSSGTPVTIRQSSCGTVDQSSSNSNISAGVLKSEYPKSLTALGDTGSSVTQRDCGTCSEISSQQSKSGSDSSASRPLPNQYVVISADSITANNSILCPATLTEESVSVVPTIEGRRDPLSGSNSVKDHQWKPGKKIQSQNQVSGQNLSMSGLPSQAVDSGASDAVETKTNISMPITSENMSPASDQPSVVVGSFSNAVELKVCSSEEGTAHSSSVFSTDRTTQHHEPEKSLPQDKLLAMEDEDEGTSEVSESVEISGLSSDSITTNSADGKQSELDSSQTSALVSPKGTVVKAVQQELNETVNYDAKSDKTSDNLEMSASATLEPEDLAALNRNGSLASNETVSESSGTPDQHPASVLTSGLSEATSKHDKDDADPAGGGVGAYPSLSPKEKPGLEPNKVKPKGKKKRREILQKADAAGTTSDLYNAFKGPEEKKETVLYSEITESTSASGNSKESPVDSTLPEAVVHEKGGQNKGEPDDWEDAADVSTPELEFADKSQQVGDGGGNMAKKYSRDFLFKFAEQCTDLPVGFEITADIADVLMSPNVSSSHLVERDSYPSPGRIIDRPGGASRLDRRNSGLAEEDRWGKLPGSYGPGHMRLDTGFGGNPGFRPSQGGNFSFLKNSRVQTPFQHAGGILSGPFQSMGSHGGMQRNTPDAERWQRATNFQKGLIPSPQPPLQTMHKAEKKYEVGKVADEEEAKQRQLKAILNKLTPQNFEKLFEQVKAVNIDNAGTLTGVISQIFDKALMEPTFCEMYADFCFHLAGELPNFGEDNEKITFKRLLLNKCQEEFERGEREQEEANKTEEDGEVKQSEEQREEKRIKARRRMLGNIRLIGELYKKKMLTERIMHECIKKLLGHQHQDPDEEDIEALCKLMSTIGEMIDHPRAKEHMDAYFDRMNKLSENMNFSSRVRFMLKDAIDLRKNKWQQRRKVEGPKKIEEVHRDAAQERQAQVSRLGRGPGINPSTRRAPMEFSPRGSTILSSPGAQMGGFRAVPAQVRGFGAQDVRLEDKQPYETRPLSVPLPQRPLGDDSFTLGPQGGLARGMSIRGPHSISSSPITDSASGDSRRMTAGLNGYSNLSERISYSSREDFIPRYIPDRFAGPAAFDQSSALDRNINYGSREMRNFDRSFTSPARAQVQPISQNVPSEKIWPEERLRVMSIAAIKEFYSARDEKEVAECVKDLNAPSFHPSMVSLWVMDSFERKDTERDLLAKLLVNLTRSRDGILSQDQLIKGFESVLATLEDAVNDAPRAPEFLGGIFAKVITENVVSLKEIGNLLKGGEEPGCLIEAGHAANVLGTTLEVMKLEKGDKVLGEIHKSSYLRLEDFRPPDPMKSRKLEKFI